MEQDHRESVMNAIDDGLVDARHIVLCLVMMQEGLTWFRKHHPKAYMTLLD